MAASSQQLATGSLSVAGATALLVGNVIGISIFTLPGPLAGSAGPSVIFAILLAMVPLGFGIAMDYQLGSAIPVAGGNYVYASRIVSPSAGFLVPWIIVPGVWAGLLFIGVGFSNYVGLFVDVPTLALIYTVLIPFLVLNIVGINPVARVQMVLVAILLVSMAVFIVPGALAIDPGNYTPLFPHGVGEFGLSVVSLYFPLRGFSMIVALGEELEDPTTSIPTVLGFAAAITLTLFATMVAVLVGVVHHSELVSVEGAIVEAGRTFLPEPLAAFLAIGAVVGGLTSISTTYTGFSRTLMRAARDEVIPRSVATVHPRFETPHVSLLVLGVPPLFLAPVVLRGLENPSVVLSVFLAVAVLFAMSLKAVALWKLPAVFEERWENADVTFTPRTLKLLALGTLVSAVVFILITASQTPAIVGMLICYSVIGLVYFTLGKRQLRRRDVDLDAVMSTLAEYE
ncbi:APC family permease [Halocatena halophila]|uniref:APC family permease n=1 Tax=Halocatena halophila TaxID=2814576 RepID=UPI002ED41AF2